MRQLILILYAGLITLTLCCTSRKAITGHNGYNGLYVRSVDIRNEPLFVNRPENIIITFSVECCDPGKDRKLQEVVIDFSDRTDFSGISHLSVKCESESLRVPILFGQSEVSGRNCSISGDFTFKKGKNNIVIAVTPEISADLTAKIIISDLKLVLGDDSFLQVPSIKFPVFRLAAVLRAAGQDNCDTYRIPGLVTTSAGTLIAVYDNRYNNSKDLQEDIDIGMSRSTDGGTTWDPMKVIIDMGEYGGLSRRLNGTGDPCILYDSFTNTIWVAALWMSGSSPDKMLWWASQPGMTPQETGQFILVKSTDDGITWSQPVNITGQIKDPSWQLLLQGPGRGITLKDGTLVFPAQFKADIGVKALDGGQYTCHSTIVYSRDKGKTWHIGSGAKPNTTESQVVQLTDGSLMLNMRDDRNRIDKGATNGRAVAVTSDLGKTWIIHPSSNSALPEPNCMASIISADINLNGTTRNVLFFSNPNDKSSRIRMTVKASLDEGMTWPAKYWLELYSPACFGYSCMTMVDNNTVGILYEGSKELFFQKIPVKDLIGD